MNTTSTKRKTASIRTRVNKLIGQLEAFVRNVESEKDAYEIIMLLSACRGAFNAITVEVIEKHIQGHIIEANNPRSVAKSGKKLIQIMKSFWN